MVYAGAFTALASAPTYDFSVPLLLATLEP